ncbi:hypothetical protein DMH26_00465 [Streptomyces sp. WAC 05379]|uniref:hypothetical protein n=1 Tax=Streptomyces sp. WAC 05379 TaxID=2203207 RepID=UPI000F73FD88|nr:hypothetical protein [Streptomyces sp. WAC 05379]RSO10005.1 hypothetical protein DMH26_00465 [Streptomyces sp. WAC 05379]
MDECHSTSAAARALRGAKHALGAAMVQDYEAGKDEEEIVREVTFVLSEPRAAHCCTPLG